MIVKTVRTYILWLLTSAIFIPFCLLLALLPKHIRYDNRLYFILTTGWNKLLVFFSFIELKVHGREHMPHYPHAPSIIVLNHISALDIPLAELVVGSYPHIWFSKEEYRKIPLFGILLHRMHVLVKRDSPRAALTSLHTAYTLAHNNNRHIIMFPEGTRSADGSLGKFFSGFAILAKKLNRPVIPVAIINADKIMPKQSYLINPRAAKVHLIIGKPMHCGSDETADQFVERVHEWFENDKKKGLQ